MTQPNKDSFEALLSDLLCYCKDVISARKLSDDVIFDPFFNFTNYITRLNVMGNTDTDVTDNMISLFQPYIAGICMKQDFSFLDSGVVLRRNTSITQSNGYEYYFDITLFWRMMEKDENKSNLIYRLLNILSVLFIDFRASLLAISNTYYMRSQNGPGNFINEIMSTVTDTLNATGYGKKIGGAALGKISGILSNVGNMAASNGDAPASDMIKNIMSSSDVIDLLGAVSLENNEDEEDQ